MTEPKMPQLAIQKFGAFPDVNYLPKAVRADIEKLFSLRTKRMDAEETVRAALKHISTVEAEVIKQAIDALADGKDAEPDADMVDKAQADALVKLLWLAGLGRAAGRGAWRTGR